MSHFNPVMSGFKNKERLIKACQMTGMGEVVLNGTIRGYGDQVTQAEIAVVIRDNEYDLGFDWNPEGAAFQANADWSGLSGCRIVLPGEEKECSVEKVFQKIVAIYAKLGIEELSAGRKLGVSPNVTVSIK